MYLLPQIIAWLVALAWILRVAEALRGLPSIPDLAHPQHDIHPASHPSITVIVPGRNEEANVRASLQSLLAQDYPNLTILAVDDRSTDATGTLMESLASPRLRVLHIAELPPQWLGKPHAMATAAAQANSDFLLFTDADVIFRSDAIRRALAYAVASRADHLVLAPTTLIKRWDEAALLAFFQVVGLWAARPWKVADPAALRDAIGVGAFNLLRTSAYRKVGGFEALRMEIVEDLGLARRIKAAGLRQRFAIGKGLVNVHWAFGINGIVNVMIKNLFAIFHFRIALALVACAWLLLFCMLPFVAVWSAPFTAPALLVLAAMAVAYWLMRRPAGLSPWNFPLAPFAAAAFIYALVRSTVITLYQGGVIWRGTFYPLADLRLHSTTIFPRKPTRNKT